MVIHFFYWLSINSGGAALPQGWRGPRRMDVKRNHLWAQPLIESPGQSFRDCSVNDYMQINNDGACATWDMNIRCFSFVIWSTHSHTLHQMKQTRKAPPVWGYDTEASGSCVCVCVRALLSSSTGLLCCTSMIGQT